MSSIAISIAITTATSKITSRAATTSFTGLVIADDSGVSVCGLAVPVDEVVVVLEVVDK